MPYSLVIPWRGGCKYRERALKYVADRFKSDLPQLKLIRVDYEDGEWCKANPIRRGLELAAPGPVVVADADCWTDGIPQALKAVEHGAPWAIPHLKVYRLDREGSNRYMKGERPITGLPLAERVIAGRTGGGVVVAERDTLLDVPPDPRFLGWGNEDEAWAIALRFLKGKPWRGIADMAHLWHPPQSRLSRRWGSPENRRLRQRYQKAQQSPESMRELLQEAHDAYSTPLPPLHDHQP